MCKPRLLSCIRFLHSHAFKSGLPPPYTQNQPSVPAPCPFTLFFSLWSLCSCTSSLSLRELVVAAKKKMSLSTAAGQRLILQLEYLEYLRRHWIWQK